MKKEMLSTPAAYPSKANTNYNDLMGSISIDFPGDFDKNKFENYAEEKGIVLDKYEPIGIRIFDTENTGIKNMYVSIIAIDIELHKKYKNENIDKIPLIEFKNVDNFDSLRKYLHRIEIVLTENNYENKDMEIIARMSKEED
jgi:hypothetical protein